jgi:hypothetical protein
MRAILPAILLWPAIALAEPPGEAEKTAALREAYRIAGPGVSWGMVDMGVTIVPKALPDPVAGVVHTVPVPPSLRSGEASKVAQAAPVERNVCTRHGKRKVMRNNGKSWRCK